MYQLTIEPLGTTIEVEENQTLLDAALRQGIYLPHACGHGMCGSCKVDVADGEVSEGAFGISSDYAQKLTDTVFLTNDTDIIWSESDTNVINDLAVSVSMTETLALRASVLTDYNSEPGTAKNTDNTFGVSLVYSFN